MQINHALKNTRGFSLIFFIFGQYSNCYAVMRCTNYAIAPLLNKNINK